MSGPKNPVPHIHTMSFIGQSLINTTKAMAGSVGETKQPKPMGHMQRPLLHCKADGDTLEKVARFSKRGQTLRDPDAVSS